MPVVADVTKELLAINTCKLETFKITCKDANLALLHIPDSSDRGYPPEYAPRGNSRFLNLDNMFPCLTTLKISARHGSLSDVDETDFAGLPSTLTKLITPNIVIKNPFTRVCASLPRSLLIWKATLAHDHSSQNSGLFPAEFWDDAPPGLHTISSIFFNRATTINSCEVLPRSLVSCGFASTTDFIFNPQDAMIPPHAMQTLPPHFANLEGIPIDLTVFNTRFPKALNDYSQWNLPPKVTSIEIRASRSSEDVPHSESRELLSVDFIRSLPSSLKKLRIANYGNLSIDWSTFVNLQNINENLWPSNLVTLDLRHALWGPSHPDMLKCLPNTLKSLALAIDTPIFDPNQISGSLTSLELNARLDWGQVFKILPGLHDTLLTLQISSTDSVIDFSDYPTLPRSITTLKLSTPNQQSYGKSEFLPPLLTSIAVYAWDPTWTADLPRTLTALELFCLGQDTNETLQDLFKNLPTSLKTLRLLTSGHGTFDDACFSRFPLMTRLHTLSLQCGLQTPSILTYLPLSLRYITLRLTEWGAGLEPYINPYWLAIDITANSSVPPVLVHNRPPEAHRFSATLMATQPQSRESAVKRAHLYPDPRVVINKAKN